VDLSGSMSEPDMSLDGTRVARLAAVKRIAGDFIERRIGDRLGLVLFGTKPYLQVPLTFDRRIVRTLLEEAVIGLAGRATALGDAIGLAIKRLRERPAASRVLVLLTDGASNAGTLAPRQAVQLAHLHGLRIYTIGFGADPPARQAQASAHDLDEATLRRVADATGGRYFRARNAGELTAIYALLDDLEPLNSDREQLRPVTDLFHLPLALALLLSGIVAAGVLAPRGRSRSTASTTAPGAAAD
ncbi:MAG: VWA domain-containing protein, partial [Gammaproteobacteria bacterium]|nr:VWA domain-containing protein [Gammaproteobacteria bacterium]